MQIHRIFDRAFRSTFVRDVRRVASGTLVAQFSIIAVSPILTRLYGPEDFGIFALVVAAASILATFASGRLDVLIPFTRSLRDSIAMARLMLISVTIAGLGVLLTIMITGVLFFSESFAGHTMAISILFPFMAIGIALMAAVRGIAVRESCFRAIGYAQILRGAILIGVSILLGIYWEQPVAGAGLLFGQLAGDLIFSFGLIRTLPPIAPLLLLRIRGRRMITRALRDRASVRMLLTTQAVAIIYERAPVFAIATCFGAAEAGYYALAQRIAGGPSSLVASAFDDVFRQRASSRYNLGRRFDDILLKGLWLTVSISLVPFAILMALTPSLMVPFFGLEWEGAIYTMVLMLGTAFFSFNSKAFDKTLIIMRARGFVYFWHSLRFILEGCAAGAAYLGVVDYKTFLAVVTGGRTLLYCMKLGAGHYYARTLPLPREAVVQ